VRSFKESQLKVLSDVCRDVGQVSLASAVVPPLISGLDRELLRVVTLGVAVSLVFWLLSILLVRRVKS